MSLLVQKFGGSAMSSISNITKAANRIKEDIQNNHNVIAIVSAMHGETDKLVKLFKEISFDDMRQELLAEHDVVVSSGEQIVAGLLAAALIKIGIPARSFTAWQVQLIAKDNH